MLAKTLTTIRAAVHAAPLTATPPGVPPHVWPGRGSDVTDTEAMPNLSVAWSLLIPLAIFAVSIVTIEISHTTKFIATLWTANAVLLTALLRHTQTPRNYASLLIGGALAIWLANVASGNSIGLSAVLMMANIVEVTIALFFLRLFTIDGTNLTQFRNLLIFIVFAGGVAPIASAAIAATEIEAARGEAFLPVWRGWYLANGLGQIIVVPFLICVTSSEWQSLRIRERLGEVAAVFTLVIVACLCAAYFRSVLFLIVPAILFATIRFGLAGSTTATLLGALIVCAFVIAGIGDPLLSKPELSERILGLQMILAFTSLWSLPAAALLAERDRLLADLSQANSHLKMEGEIKSRLVAGLRRHLSVAEENERLRLSHELHDQAGQGLIAAILELNEIDAQVYGTAHERLHLVRRKMEELGKTLHRIAWELRPPSIDELGLRKALASYVAEWGDQCGTDVDFHCDDASLDSVPVEIGTAVYRVVQEGLTNIVKHAGTPSNASVIIRCTNATLQVIVEDNGCGFDVGAITKAARRGLGLDGMRERLLLIGGTLEIESVPGSGTTIFARIALDAQRSAA